MKTILARGALVGRFFPLLLVVAGCTDNDRYVFVGPAGPDPVVGADGGALEAFTLPTLDHVGDEAPCARTADGLALADGRRVFLLAEDRCEAVPWAGSHGVAGLAADGAGGLWALDEAGLLARLEGGTWEVAHSLPEGGYGLLVRTVADGLLACRAEGVVWRVDGPRTQRLEAPLPVRFRHAWNAPDGSVWFAGTRHDTCAVLVLDGDAWRVDLLVTLENLYGNVAFAAADTGRMLVGDRGREVVAEKVDGAWTWTTLPRYWDDAFYQDGALHLADGRRVLRRVGGAFEEHDLGDLRFRRALPWDDDHLLLGEDGLRGVWTGTALAQRQPALGRIVAAFETADGGDGVLLYRGLVLRRDGRAWTVVDALPGSGDGTQPYVHRAVPDGPGALHVALDARLHRWQDGVLTACPGPEEITELFPLDDGTLHVQARDRCWRVRGTDVVGALDHPSLNGYAVGGAVWDARGAHLGTEEALYRLEDGAATPVVTFPDRRASFLHADGAGALVVGGPSLLRWRDGALTDLGPATGREVYLMLCVAAGDGGLLVYDYREGMILHHDGRVWTLFNPPGRVPGVQGVVRRSDGSFCLWGHEEAWRFAPVVAP